MPLTPNNRVNFSTPEDSSGVENDDIPNVDDFRNPGPEKRQRLLKGNGEGKKSKTGPTNPMPEPFGSDGVGNSGEFALEPTVTLTTSEQLPGNKSLIRKKRQLNDMMQVRI